MNRNSLMNALENPERAWIVLVVGLVLIYRECSAPGRVLPGVLGAVGVCLSLYSLSQKSLHSEAVGMIAIGVGLVFLQVLRKYFWLPGVSGAVLVMLGVNRLTDPPIRLLLAALSLPLSGITIFLLRTAILARRNKVSLQ